MFEGKILNIQVREGGERLYLHPFSYKDERYWENKVIYTHPDEFRPYSTFLHTLDSDDGMAKQIVLGGRPLASLWYLYIKKFLKVLAYTTKWTFRPFSARYVCVNLAYFWYTLKHTYSTMAVLWAADYPGFRFSVQNQLLVDDPEGHTTTIYLVPSEKYLRKRMFEYLYEDGDRWEGEEPTYYRSDLSKKVEILKWVKREMGCGRKIGCLASVDT